MSRRNLVQMVAYLTSCSLTYFIKSVSLIGELKMEVKIMNAGTVSFSSRGQIVIPSVFRKEFGIQTGTKAIVMSKDNAIIIRPITNESVKSSFGRHCGKNLLKVLEELKKTEREL